jgi:Flp pilus assembly protein TadG
MEQSMFNWRIETLRQMLRDARGNVATMVGIAAIPLATVIGVAVDYSRVQSAGVRLQAAVDAAALGTIGNAAVATSANDVATKLFNANFSQQSATNKSVSGAYDSTSKSVVVKASATIATNFGAILGRSSYTLTRSATASLAQTTTPVSVCLLITDADAGHALKTAGQSKLDVYNCMVQVNTSDWDAVQADDTSYIHIDTPNQAGNWNCYVGQIHFGDVSPAKQASCTLLPDPYQNVSLPTNYDTCTDRANYAISSGSHTFSPGTYCGDIKVTGTAAITFNPGVYVFNGNQVSFGGASSVTGNGVVFILTGQTADSVQASDPAGEWSPPAPASPKPGKRAAKKASAPPPPPPPARIDDDTQLGSLSFSTTGAVTLTYYQGTDYPALDGFLIYQDQSIFGSSDCACGMPIVMAKGTITTSGIIYAADDIINTQGVAWTHTGSLVADMLLPNSASQIKLYGSTSTTLTKNVAGATIPVLSN